MTNNKITHIYSGSIVDKDMKVYHLIEYKIEKDSLGDRPLFKKTNFHAGWFYLDHNDQIEGPYDLCIDSIKVGVRKIISDRFADLTIKNVIKPSNNSVPSHILSQLKSRLTEHV